MAHADVKFLQTPTLKPKPQTQTLIPEPIPPIPNSQPPHRTLILKFAIFTGHHVILYSCCRLYSVNIVADDRQASVLWDRCNHWWRNLQRYLRLSLSTSLWKCRL